MNPSIWINQFSMVFILKIIFFLIDSLCLLHAALHYRTYGAICTRHPRFFFRSTKISHIDMNKFLPLRFCIWWSSEMKLFLWYHHHIFNLDESAIFAHNLISADLSTAFFPHHCCTCVLFVSFLLHLRRLAKASHLPHTIPITHVYSSHFSPHVFRHFVRQKVVVYGAHLCSTQSPKWPYK